MIHVILAEAKFCPGTWRPPLGLAKDVASGQPEDINSPIVDRGCSVPTFQKLVDRSQGQGNKNEQFERGAPSTSHRAAGIIYIKLYKYVVSHRAS